jgi:hypothetical protein
MTADSILSQLTEGTVLEGPHWTEAVRVLTAKARGARIEVQAVGILSKRLWTKLLKLEDFEKTIKLTHAGKLAWIPTEKQQLTRSQCVTLYYRMAIRCFRLISGRFCLHPVSVGSDLC